MAEHLSVGRDDPLTAMWLRGYALREDLPTIEQLTSEPQTYFPCRFGQAYSAYVGGKYGDVAVANFFRLAGRVCPDSAFVSFVQGDNDLEILDVESGSVERRISPKGIGAIANPASSSSRSAK